MSEFASRDCADAANALLAWIESQNIMPVDAVPVLLLAAAGTIHQVAINRGLDPMEGGMAACSGLMAALELAEKTS